MLRLPLLLLSVSTSILALGCAPAAPASAPAPPVAAGCVRPEYRQFDFWIGEWDAVVRAHPSEGAADWVEARGQNRITRILGGCAVEESFTAEGPGAPWAGKSLSRFVEKEGQWRQAWVDDSGSYLPFTGGWKDGQMILVGEPATREGVERRMRMVFSDITASRFRWRWERTTDAGVTWTPVMFIDYARRK